MTDELNENAGSNVVNLGGAKAGEEGQNAGLLVQPDANTLKRFKGAADEIDNIAEERSALTARKTALLESLCADFGANKHAVLAAMQYVKLSDEKRLNWDLTYQVTRKALGHPVQQDLFDAQLAATTQQAVAKSARGGK